MQYFIKPLWFESKETKEELLADITFRYRDEVKDSVTLNFSVLGPRLYKEIDSLKMAKEEFELQCKKIKRMFNEKEKKNNVSRFTCKAALKDIMEAFKSDHFSFILYIQGEKLSFTAPAKTRKAIRSIHEGLFESL